MINAVDKVLNAYYACLNGKIPNVEVYVVSVDEKERGNYIVLRAESENDTSNKTNFVTSVVIIADITTNHQGAIKANTVEGIDNAMRQLIFPDRRTLGLDPQEGIQILNVVAESATYLENYDGSVYEHRKITRFVNRINQI